MVWKVLEALGMLLEALGSFDVNTVCPLPGSWINHELLGLLTTVYGNIVFSRSKKHAWHKRLMFFHRFSICSCSLRLYKAL